MKASISKIIFLRSVATVLSLLLLVGAYSLPVPPAYAQSCGGAIGYGQTLIGQVSVGAACRYRFAGEAGGSVTIKMTKNSAMLDPWLDLLDPAGRIVVSDDDSAGDSNSLISNYRLSVTGDYTIVAKSYNNASAGNFTLQLGMPNENWVRGTIARVGQRQEYIFYGEQNAVVSIWMEKDSDTLDPWLDLKDPAGYIVASDDDSYGNSNSLISNYRILTSGVYTIIARAYNDATAGPFYVLLTQE